MKCTKVNSVYLDEGVYIIYDYDVVPLIQQNIIINGILCVSSTLFYVIFFTLLYSLVTLNPYDGYK